MTWLRGILKEVLALFVDDGSLAIAVLVWISAFAALYRYGAFAEPVAGPVLFLGLLAILIENALRRARN